MNFINSLLEGLRSIISNIKQIELPKGTDLPAEATGGETGEKDNKTVEVTSVSISGANKVKVGETITLTATVKPSDATNKKVTWKSSNPTYATVDENTGVVKGLEAGIGEKVIITATTSNKITAEYEVSVEAADSAPGGGDSTGGTTIDSDEVLIGTKLNVSNITVSNITEGNAVSVGGFSIFDDNKR
ncbi:MAG: Ig domain-containing protein [Clostridia bacterium]|nr:Ig domain-containing protein [Clostridia bacterium]